MTKPAENTPLFPFLPNLLSKAPVPASPRSVCSGVESARERVRIHISLSQSVGRFAKGACAAGR
jgi:hypothetical protein